MLYDGAEAASGHAVGLDRGPWRRVDVVLGSGPRALAVGRVSAVSEIGCEPNLTAAGAVEATAGLRGRSGRIAQQPAARAKGNPPLGP